MDARTGVLLEESDTPLGGVIFWGKHVTLRNRSVNYRVGNVERVTTDAFQLRVTVCSV